MAPIAFAAVLFCGLRAAAEEEKRTEVFRIERIEAQQALVTIRSLAGAKEIEVLDLHNLSIHDTEERLVIARKVVELLARDGVPPATYDVGDGTWLAGVTLRHASSRDAARLLMSEIGIRKVATAQELALVLFRDSPEQVEKALEALRAFDKAD